MQGKLASPSGGCPVAISNHEPSLTEDRRDEIWKISRLFSFSLVFVFVFVFYAFVCSDGGERGGLTSWLRPGGGNPMYICHGRKAAVRNMKKQTKKNISSRSSREKKNLVGPWTSRITNPAYFP
jgi:hypothetical protein